MKKLLILLVVLFLAANAGAVERKGILDIDIDALISDTQPDALGAGDSHIASVWWIPFEFWQRSLEGDATISETERKELMEVFKGISLIAIAQADVSSAGSLNFYSKDEVAGTMALTYIGGDGKKQILQTQEPSLELELVLALIKPMLSSVIGDLGEQLHFYVLNDKSKSGSRIVDPYVAGRIDVELAKRNKQVVTATIETPLNALFIPRKCPNGKEAHVTWRYCPWTGQKLPD